jgi:hypothetical protein
MLGAQTGGGHRRTDRAAVAHRQDSAIRPIMARPEHAVGLARDDRSQKKLCTLGAMRLPVETSAEDLTSASHRIPPPTRFALADIASPGHSDR